MWKDNTFVTITISLFPNSSDALYISIDDLYFSGNNLLNFAEIFARKGGKCLFIDEVHKYPNWSQELKNIYDNIPEINIVFTSSSALQIYKGSHDLSRRVLMYSLKGMSFREFLELKYNYNFDSIKLDEILSFPEKSSSNIINKIKPYKYFSEYLSSGYFPFFIDGSTDYLSRIVSTINLVLEYDLPTIESIDYKSVYKLKKLIYLLSLMVPYKPNISKLAQQIEVTRSTLLKYLDMLHRAHILLLLGKDSMGINLINKPEKIYLHNPNLFYALNPEMPNIGSIRETFFINQLSQKHKINYSDKVDFLVDNKYSFEIGGKNKTRKQIKEVENAFIVKDDIEFGYENVIPLYLFGFLY